MIVYISDPKNSARVLLHLINNFSKVARNSFIVENVFYYPGFFFPDEVENCSFYLCEDLSWTADMDCIESVDCFW